MMNREPQSNGHQISGFITNTEDLMGEHLKTIRQLARKLTAKDDQMAGNQFIQRMSIIWCKVDSLCEMLYSKAINYNHLDNQSGINQLVQSNTQNDDNNNQISRYNGLKSLIKVVSRFVVHVERGLDDGGMTIDCSVDGPLVQISEMLIHLIETVSELFTSKQAIGNGKDATLYLLDTYLKSRDKLTKGIKFYWSHYPSFWMEEDAQWVQSYFSLASSSLSRLPYSLMSLVSRSAHGHWQENLLHSANPYYPLNLANYLNNPLFRGISWVTCKYSGLVIKEVQVPRQTKWYVPFDEEGGDGKVKFMPNGNPFHPAAKNPQQLKCRLVHQSGIEPNGDIIFHVQGGAFTVELSTVFDQCFRHWAPRLKGAVILDVYYSRFVRYPVQVQELLDVFLWLANAPSNDVKSVIGFVPRKIIFCGDSAGGLFLFSLVPIIRDVQLLAYSLKHDDKPFLDHLYPKALVTFYPVLSITMPTVQPSLIMAFVEQFLTPLTILNCLSLYSSGIIFDTECSNLEYPDSSRYLQPDRWQAFYNTWLGQKKIWLECDKVTLDKRIDQIAGAALSPYKSPLISYDLNQIKDLNIHLIVGEFDPFLDTNIEFSQRWPGKSTIDVIDDLGHGFLALTWTSVKCRKAARVCLNRLLEALAD